MKRLYDLVNCRQEELRVAFYYALRDTLVAGDLEQASRIAYGPDRRWRRVVTLKARGAVRGQQGRGGGAAGRQQESVGQQGNCELASQTQLLTPRPSAPRLPCPACRAR